MSTIGLLGVTDRSLKGPSPRYVDDFPDSSKFIRVSISVAKPRVTRFVHMEVPDFGSTKRHDGCLFILIAYGFDVLDEKNLSADAALGCAHGANGTPLRVPPQTYSWPLRTSEIVLSASSFGENRQHCGWLSS